MFPLLLVSLLAGSAIAIPRASIHEQRRASDALIAKRSPVAEDAVVPVRIGLTQRNLDKGYDHLMNIASPDSPNYGSIWTSQQVHKEFAPAPETAARVIEWLTSSGIEGVKQSAGRGWIAFDAAASRLKELFGADLYEYEDNRMGRTRLGCDQYSVPEHLSSDIDYITPGVKLSPPVQRSVLARSESLHRRLDLMKPAVTPPRIESYVPPASAAELPSDLQDCGLNITPPCIRALYAIPDSTAHLAEGSIGVFENEDAYSQADLDDFFATYLPNVPNSTHPTLVSINGAQAPVNQSSYSNTGESDVDFALVYSVLGDVNVTLYQTQNPSNASYQVIGNATLVDAFLDAIDGSFCTDEQRDAGFECGGVTLSTVLSASYQTPELFLQSLKSQQRVCNEFMKLSLQGHTIVFSSGDYGVAANPGFGEELCVNNGCIPQNLDNAGYSTFNGTIFNTGFPSNCPYVLSVGGTMLQPNQTVQDPESAMNVPGAGFAGCDGRVTFSSSGGFSNYFERPAYQDDAVSAYFTDHDPGYPSYNVSNVDVSENDTTTIGKNGGIYARNGRGFPDVSANGANLAVFNMGRDMPFSGTSLSTPIWASIIALINGERNATGKGPVGFVQPVLYQNPQVFNDVVNGSNAGCGTEGFPAVPGWDPITGLGTPNYPKLLDLFMGLP